MHNYASSNQAAFKIGIVGARGYSGLDLARLILRHPQTELAACFASDANAFALSEYLTEEEALKVPTFPMSALETEGAKLHTIFLATPAEVSIELAPKITALGVNVIDLSGAFRLDAAQYPEWYGFEHGAPSALQDAVYGLVPFAAPFSAASRKAGQGTLVSNPGCYATSVLMALIPLLKAGVIDASTLVIDAKSGTSGAGKKPSENLLFTEVDGECLPYKVGKHQHFPEITAYAKKFGGADIDPHFSTSLLPTRRGIISGVYARLVPGKTEADVTQAFESAYAGYPLVKFGSLGKKPAPQALQLKKVVGSARTHIRYVVEGNKLYLHSLIDNLMKGAASQAIENFNRLVDLAPHTALKEQEGTL